jgi:hypothetical protein
MTEEYEKLNKQIDDINKRLETILIALGLSSEVTFDNKTKAMFEKSFGSNTYRECVENLKKEIHETD